MFFFSTVKRRKRKIKEKKAMQLYIGIVRKKRALSEMTFNLPASMVEDNSVVKGSVVEDEAPVSTPNL